MLFLQKKHHGCHETGGLEQNWGDCTPRPWSKTATDAVGMMKYTAGYNRDWNTNANSYDYCFLAQDSSE